MTDTLRERCHQLLMQLDEGPTTHFALEQLMAFVQSETGRTADAKLENARSLILYFNTDEDRDGFIEDFKEAKPNVRTEKLP